MTRGPLMLTLMGLALLGARPAFAQPAPRVDTESIWTIQGENDKVSTTPGGSDKYYTSGLRLGWTSGLDQVPGFAKSLAASVWGDGITRIAVDVTQQIYTPENTDLLHPNPHDHPVAGYLAGTFSSFQDVGNSRGTLALSLGVVGPLALGRQVQNGFHELIGDAINKGWGSQLPNEPAIELMASKVWRVPVFQTGGIETDVLPSATLGVGTVRDYAQTGILFRVGQGLDSDFGVSRLRPGISGGDAYVASAGVPWYVFAGADGQAVARDAFLDGDIWSKSAHVRRKWFMGEMELGAAVFWHGARFSYTQTWQTASFYGQKRGLFNFGSLAMSVKF